MVDPHAQRTDPLATGDASETMAGGELQRRAASGSFWTATHTVIAAPLGFVVNAVVARVLGPVEYGGLALLTLALAIATQVTNFGVSNGTIQWGAEASVRGSRRTVELLLAKSLGYHLAVQLPLLLATVVVLGRNEGLVVGVLMLGIALPTALGSAALLISIENRTAAGAKLAMLSNLLVQAAVLLAAVTTESPTWVWAARILASALLLPLNFLVLDRWGRKAALRVSWPRSLPSGFWWFATTSMLAGLAGLLVFSRSEIIVLTWFASAVEVGLFALAFGVAAQVTAPVDALIGPLTPAAAGLVAAHPDRVRAGRDRSVRAASFLSGGILATVVPLLVTGLVLLYGEDYEEARIPLLALAAMSCLRAACNPLATFVSARRMGGRILQITTTALVVDMGFAMALIPAWGLAGAIVANIAAQVVYAILLAATEARQEEEPMLAVLLGMRSWLVGLAAALLGIWLSQAIVDNPWGASFLSFLAGAAFYTVGVRMSRSSLTRADWSVLSEAVPRVLRPAVEGAARVFGRA
jgi:O-antigen/teichoic acid export membrane protein